MSEPSDFISNDLDIRRLLENIIKLHWTGWPCPNCKIPTWTGVDGCPICGLRLYEAQVLNGYRKSFCGHSQEIRVKRALPCK